LQSELKTKENKNYELETQLHAKSNYISDLSSKLATVQLEQSQCTNRISAQDSKIRELEDLL